MGTGIAGSLWVKLGLDSKQFDRGVGTAQGRISRFERGIASARNAMVALGSAYVVGRMVKGVVDAFAEQEQAVISLRAALEATGRGGAAALDTLTKRAAELQKVTTHGDEAVIKATASFAQLATALDARELADAQKAIIGIADTFLGGDVNNAALLLGKTLGSTTNALTRYGITIDTSATQSEKLAQVLAQSDVFFRVSQERATSLSGRIEQLKNKFGDLKEEIGAQLLPVLDALLPVLNTMIEGITQYFLPNLRAFVGGIQMMGADLAVFVAQAKEAITALKFWDKGAQIDAHRRVVEMRQAAREVKEEIVGMQAAFSGLGTPTMGATPAAVTPTTATVSPVFSPDQLQAALVPMQNMRREVGGLGANMVELSAGSKAYFDKLREGFNRTQELAMTFADSFSLAIVDSMKTGMDAFTQFANHAIRELLRIAAKAAVLRIIGSVLPGFGQAATAGNMLYSMNRAQNLNVVQGIPS